jgi:hypothetical protein
MGLAEELKKELDDQIAEIPGVARALETGSTPQLSDKEMQVLLLGRLLIIEKAVIELARQVEDLRS